MKKNRLGTSDLYVSEISFGCMSLQKDNPENENLIREAVDNGVNFFDTADIYDYGWNEKVVGEALKPIRDDVIIATKVGHVQKGDGMGWEWRPTKKHILSNVEESLKRLQTDRIDLYQLHGGTLDDPIDDIIEAFELLKAQGKIREYGISSIRPNVIRTYVKKGHIASVMMQYSLLDRRPEESCLDLLHKSEISVLTRGSLAKGILVDKPATEMLGYSLEEVEEMQKAVQETGNPIGISLQFVLSHPAVASAVVGVRTGDQLKEICQFFDDSVTEKELKKVANLLEKNVYHNHR
ncbi:MAG: aldo/keto reductase [Balneolaceae bacterium]